MVRPDMAKWGQEIKDLLRLSVESDHARTRERFLALYQIGSGQTNATSWSSQSGRHSITVISWVHRYNEHGPEALIYRRSGGHPPLFCPEEVAHIVATVKESVPVEHDLPGYNWTIKKLRQWVKQVLGCDVSRSLLRKILKDDRLSWKKCQKVLAKANPEQRAAFIQEFQAIFDQVCREEMRLVYIDESHFHRDMDLGYTWAETGKPAWRLSDCPPLQDRIDWYGAYDFAQGQCFLWNEGSCNGEHTVEFLRHLAQWLGPLTVPVVIVWDGAPCHKAKVAQAAAAELGFTLLPLPGYSPDLNPIEGLWKWMRADVTQNHCYATVRDLFDACQAFIQRINADALQVIQRLWPKLDLDPEFEKLLVST